MRRTLTAILLLAVLGCSEVWIRPGTTQYQFSQDRAHCTRQSAIKGAKPQPKGKEPKVDAEKFEACMEALGYRRRAEPSKILY